MEPRYEYGCIQDWPKWPEYITSSDVLSSDQIRASFYRERNSHRGISKFQNLRELIAKQVNQDFLEEIAQLKYLEYLAIDVLTANDLNPLCNLQNIRFLKLEGVRKIENFSPLLNIKSLDKLFIENAKYLHTLDFLKRANHLRALGIEGSMWTTQKIESLKPLSNLNKLEALFMTIVRLVDKNLDYLTSISKLKVLECARFAPKSNFIKLRNSMPNLLCSWCDEYEINIP